jgi:hypothetical protein
MSTPSFENMAVQPDEPVPTAHELLVAAEVRVLRVRAEARDVLAAEKAGAVPPFDAGTLAEVLARPAEPAHRVEGLIPADAGTLVVAQRKTGKTTLELNLARALILGGDFLGRFPVTPVTGTVAVLNYEVSAAQLARWADEVQVPPDRLLLVNLRGRRNPLGNAGDREQLAQVLRDHQVESIVVDPFGRAYSGQSQNDSGEVGAWLATLDRWARGDCGVRDVVLTAHAGWDGERTRGASALEDWADSIVTLVRDKDDDQVRYLRAEGRDVLVDEDRLDFDPFTRVLTLAGAGSRKTAAKTRNLDELVPDVIRAVTAAPGMSGYKLTQAMREQGAAFQRGDEIKAAKLAVERGSLRTEPGARNSTLYFLGTTSPDLSRPLPTGHVPTSPHLPLRGGVGGIGQQSTPVARERSEPEPDDDQALATLHDLLGATVLDGAA